MTLQTALILALRMHARDAIKQRYRAARRKLSTIPPAELTRDADALIPELIPEAVSTLLHNAWHVEITHQSWCII
jgi:hypothetical protein